MGGRERLEGGAQARLFAVDWAHWRGERATLVFLLRGTRVLLIRKKRGLGAGKINGAGGKLLRGEGALACAEREVHEELGIAPRDLDARGELRFQFVDGYAIHVYVFVGSDFAGEPLETDEALPLWCDTDSLPFDEMWEDDRIWLPAVLAGGHVDGRFLFDGDAMLAYALELDTGPAQRDSGQGSGAGDRPVRAGRSIR